MSCMCAARRRNLRKDKMKGSPTKLVYREMRLATIAGRSIVTFIPVDRVGATFGKLAVRGGLAEQDPYPGGMAIRSNCLFRHCSKIDAYGNLPYNRSLATDQTTARLEARLPADVYALLKRAAEMQGRTLTDFVVSAAREAASRTIEEVEILRLSAEDQQRIAQALLQPPVPAPALARAFQRHRELFGES